MSVDEVNYKRYREEFAHNLKNPLLEWYRNLSSERPKEAPLEETENEETK